MATMSTLSHARSIARQQSLPPLHEIAAFGLVMPTHYPCRQRLDDSARLTDDQPVTQKSNARLILTPPTPAASAPYAAGRSGTASGSNSPRRDGGRPHSRRREAANGEKGRGGKTVTVVYDLPRNPEFLKELSQELKRACGAGGTVVEDRVEIQGDLRERVREALMKRGDVVKG